MTIFGDLLLAGQRTVVLMVNNREVRVDFHSAEELMDRCRGLPKVALHNKAGEQIAEFGAWEERSTEPEDRKAYKGLVSAILAAYGEKKVS